MLESVNCITEVVGMEKPEKLASEERVHLHKQVCVKKLGKFFEDLHIVFKESTSDLHI